MKLFFKTALISSLVLLLPILLMAQQTSNEADDEEIDLVAHGEYLINIAGCIGCHTPYKEAYQDFTQLTLEQVQTMSLEGNQTLDFENKLLAGGRPFDLGPMGVVFTANLTPDPETGLGDWTDEEIEAAIRVGLNKDGRRLFPIMPYRFYINMSEQDMSAIIAYLRSLPAVENEVDRSGPSGEGLVPEIIFDGTLMETAPDALDDPLALGDYLVNTVMVCGECHTPLDPATGLAMEDMLLAGGQAYEGPWGIVYGGNITPHEATGIGTWSEDDIARVMREGVRVDGRRLVLMPWEDYAVITDDDLNALITYLQSIPAIDNEIPLPAIADPFIQFVEE